MPVVSQVLSFVHSLEHPDGGLRAWDRQAAYPECTGYILPSLIEYGETALAKRCADWLIKIQRKDGAWPGFDDIPRTFDTASVVEGLRAMNVPGAAAAVERGEAWLRSMRLPDGRMQTVPGKNEDRIYSMRVSGVLGDDAPADYWIDKLLKIKDERSHYIAYCLEGLYRVGRLDFVRDYLIKAEAKRRAGVMPYMWASGNNADYCATAQFGLLRAWFELDYSEELVAMRERVDKRGAIKLSDKDATISPIWAAKYYLEFELEAARMEMIDPINTLAVVVGIDHWMDVTGPFVQSLRKHNKQLPVLLVDNGSAVPYPTNIPGVSTLRLEEQIGYGPAINRAIQAMPGKDWYILFNNDCLCDGPFVPEILKLDKRFIYGSGWNYDRINRISFQWSAWLCLSDESIKKVGLFDEKLEAAFEDFDMQLRAKATGYTLEFFDIPVRHLDKHTRLKTNNYPARWTDSRDWFVKKHGLKNVLCTWDRSG